MINLKKKFEELLKNKKFYVPFNRDKKINYQNYYNNSVDPDGNKRNLAKEKSYKVKQFKIILNYLKNEKYKKKILDIGCGYGWMLSELNKKNFDRYGVELNDDARNIAIKNKIKVFKKIEDIKKISFDYITLVHVIEHLKNPEYYLKKIKKLLKKNGVLIVETPDFDSAMARRYNLKFRLIHDKTHVSLFSLDSLCRFLRMQGFDIFKIEFPFFEGPFFNKKNLLKVLNKKKKGYSPPFYGSVMTIFSRK
jgi:2-polyprenyl-3-methyl-5-hydroxy-6-metoxy-1,4-benzoquinol methylase